MSDNDIILKFWQDIYIASIRSGRDYNSAYTDANRAVQHMADEFNIKFEDEKKTC